MADTPKENEIKYNRFLNAFKTIAPTKTFGGVTLADFETAVETSDTPRGNLERIADEKVQEETARDSADGNTMSLCERIKNGVVADPEYGDDSALYEALGFVRKSNRKSGLTRKKNDPDK